MTAQKNPSQHLSDRLLLSVVGVFFIRLAALFSFIPLVDTLFPDLSLSQTAWLIAAYPLAQTLGQIPLGMLADYMGPKKVLVWGSLLVSFSFFVAYFFSQSYKIVFFTRVLQGFLALGAPAQMWLNIESLSVQSLYNRYYLIGLGVVVGMLFGFLLTALVTLVAMPSFAFLVLGLMQLFLALGFYSLPAVGRVDLASTEEQQCRVEKMFWLLLLANMFLHSLQSMVLSAACFWPLLLEQRRSFLMLGTFFTSLILAYPAIKKRAFDNSFSTSLKIAFLGAACFFLGYLLPQFRVGAITLGLVSLFVLLLILEATLPVAWKTAGYQRGTWVGLYNTAQYAAMSAGSLALDGLSTAENYYLVSTMLFLGLAGCLKEIYRHLKLLAR